MRSSSSRKVKRERPTLSSIVLTPVRVIVAGYFLALAAATYLDPTRHTLFDSFLPPQQAHAVETYLLAGFGLAVLFNFALRIAAVALSAYMVTTTAMSSTLVLTPEILAEHAGEISIVGALLMVAALQQPASARFRGWSRPVTPNRRYAQMAMEARKAHGLDPGGRPAAGKAAAHDNVIDASRVWTPSEAPESQEEFRNIFADIWDDEPDRVA